MIKKKFSNDGTSKILGIEYQKLIALEYCLNAKKNEHIWLEYKGDVANADTSVEVKHHTVKHSISDNSEDVWKTLKNYTVEFDVVQEFSKLVLLTTSTINKDSIFFNWNSLNGIEKKSKLLTHLPTKTIKEYHESVKKFNKEKLIDILNKFSILENQKTAQIKWEELKNHPALRIIEENRREAALEKLIGYITKCAILDSKEWKININDFNRDIQDTLGPYTKKNIPFPLVGENEINSERSERKLKFIVKMKAIKLKDKDQNNAITDYLKGSLSQLKLLNSMPTLATNLEIYDEDIKRMIEDEKSSKAIEITKDDIGMAKALINSGKLFFACLTKPHEQIIGVDNTQKYYRDGRIHHNCEITDFEWEYKLTDL